MRTGTVIGVSVVLSAVLGAAQTGRATQEVSESQVATADLALRRFAMYGLSGCALLAVRDQVIVDRCAGSANRETRAPITFSTLFDIGSITKSFTAASVLDLVGNGRLSVDVTLGSIFPDVPDDKRSITIHQILTHSAGFPLDAADAGIAPADTRETFVAKALKTPLLHASGTRYAYSNLGYGLLAIVIERTSGQPFRESVGRLIRRAGLRRTTWWSEAAGMALSGAARGYLMSDREDVLEPEPLLQKPSPAAHSWGKYFLGPGGLVSTTADLHRWMRALVTHRVLPVRLTTAMFSPVLGDEAYGWHVGERTGVGRRIYRGGLRGGFTSLLAYYPERELTLAFTLNQSQSGWETLLWRTLENAVTNVPLALPPPTMALAESQRRALVGDYPVEAGNVRVWIEGEVVMAGAEGQPATDLLLGSNALPAAQTDEQNRLATEVVQAIVEGRASAAVLDPVNRRDEFRAWLVSRAPTAAPLNIRALGTTPHPSAASRAQTFVRLGEAFGAPVVRVIWEQGRIIAWGDGVRLPAIASYRPISPSAVVSFRPREPAWRTLHLESTASGRRVRVQ